MSPLRRRLHAVRSSGEQGSVLVLSLAFLLVFGLVIGVVLEFGATGARTTVLVRDAGTDTYAGGGALDGAINAVRSDLDSAVGPAAASTCFTLPSGALGNSGPVTVSCEPRSTSGTGIVGSTTSSPGFAVTAVSTTTSEGMSVPSGTTTLQGGAAINKTLAVAAGATLDSTGYPVTAGICPASGTGTVKDGCTVGGTVSDPGYPGPSTADAVKHETLPACSSTVSLLPGIYQSAAALQAVLNCADATIVFTTGTYYFDFEDLLLTHELIFDGGSRNSRIIGGAVSGTSCDPSSPGVDLAFGGDSRLRVQTGKVDLCALVPVSDTTQQHVVLRGLSEPTTLLAISVSALGVTTTASITLRQVCVLDSVTLLCLGPPVEPLFTASGSYAASPVALHGTLYAPTSSVVLGLTDVTATVVDRGVVVRHLVSSMTPVAGAPALLSVPVVGRRPRSVVMTANAASGKTLGRADVTFADSGGTRNGDIPNVVDWFVN